MAARRLACAAAAVLAASALLTAPVVAESLGETANGEAPSAPSKPPITPLGPESKTWPNQPVFDRSDPSYNSFVFWKYGFAGWCLGGVFLAWLVLYVSCRACAFDDCSPKCHSMVEFFCCTGYKREGYTSAAMFMPKVLIGIALLGMCYGAVVANGANAVWHKSQKEFLMDYSDEITVLDKEIKDVGKHLEDPGFEQVMNPVVVTARNTQASYSAWEVMRNVCVLCGVFLPLLALAFGFFGGVCMSPVAAIVMTLLCFLSTSVLFYDFGLQNMEQRYNEDLCSDTLKYSMNKTGSVGLRSYFSCPSNTSMLGPFNQSFVLLKAQIDKVNREQKARFLLGGKDMAAKDVFDAIPSPPKPKQGVFITALKVVVDEDVNALRAGLTDAYDAKNLSHTKQEEILQEMDKLATYSRIMVTTSQFSRCLYANSFFNIIDKSLCQRYQRTALKQLVEFSFWCGLAMMLCICLGIMGERRFDPMNHMSARSAESGRDDNVTAPMLASVELNNDNDEPDLPDATEV